MYDEKNGNCLKDGLSSRESLEPGYTPREAGEGDRPAPSKGKKVGKFTIK